MKEDLNDALHWAHPLVKTWFIEKFGNPTEPQQQGWPAISARKTTLISAPTGSGKTLAAFLICINELVKKAHKGQLKDETEVLYISPLKALSHDIQKNLMTPLNEIFHLAQKQGIELEKIRVAVRTGDTLASERQAMLKKPPHILVTTPESFYILLTAEKSRNILKNIRTVIVDEIHAIADDKRGAHLSLSLERLQAIAKHSPQRIGLSATQKPIERVADFLVGNRRQKLAIIQMGHKRHLELKVEVPKSVLSAVASNDQWDEIYDQLTILVNEHRTTLIFVNTRRLAERVAHHLAERLGEENVATHHGSLSRKLRLNAETRLKNGELKVLVATASLELGIDIGSIDIVCQIGSPRGIAIALQRIGRAGHWHGAISKGRIFATTRDELLECAALVKAIQENDLDELIIPDQPLDILMQQIVAICATGEWAEDELYKLIIKAYPYKNLTRETFDEILTILANGIAGSRGRYGTYLFRDQVNGVVKGRRNARLTAITNGGAIPENGLFTVALESSGAVVGTLDEDFAVESNRGDIILLGTNSWRINRIESLSGRVWVEDAHGAPPSVPFWRGEAPARTKELSWHVAELREKIANLLSDKPNAILWLIKNCGLNDFSAQQLLEYVEQGKALLGEVPTQKIIIAERFFDESGGMQLIIHAPFGARINKAWGLALRKRFCRSFNFELQAAATDDGINIALAEQHSFPLGDVFQFLHPNTIKKVLTQAVLQSPLFTTRWRWDATRSLAITRFRNGRKTPPNIQRMLADDLLAAVFPDAAACQDNLAGKDLEVPDHPLVREAMHDSLTEALDIEGLTKVLVDIKNEKIKCLAVDTPLPSVFSQAILNANPYAFLDDAPLEERRSRAAAMRQILPSDVLEEIGRLDRGVIEEVQEQVWPDIRNEDELHDLLQTLIALPEDFHRSKTQLVIPEWKVLFQKLQKQGRVGVATVEQQRFWFAAERFQSFSIIFPEAEILFPCEIIKNSTEENFENVLISLLRGWLLHLGPITSQELHSILLISQSAIDQGLLGLETSGFILRGKFTKFDEQIEWCERRILARIHRLTLAKLRKEIEPVSPSNFFHWLLKWQHVMPETNLKGELGLLEIIKQLQGYEIPANAWESQIFSKRIKNYDRDALDRLCLTGTVGWGRFSTHSSWLEENMLTIKKRITPSSVTPITFFIREEADWIPLKKSFDLSLLSHPAREIYNILQQKGASFFQDIVRYLQRLKTEVEMGLWELVAAGLITADGFDNLRALIDPKRRLNKKRRSSSLRFSSGRWSILQVDESKDSIKHLEAVCWMLLKRYGIVFRDLIVREKNIPSWRDLLQTFRRLEDRGEIRGGRFVTGFSGEQFALPYAVDSLRANKLSQTEADISLSVVDPLNLTGIILPGERIPAVSHKRQFKP